MSEKKDSEEFLARWSRRKREAERAPDSNPNEAAAPDASGQEKKEPEKKEEDFDLSLLPPIESIEAATDIRDFLRPGVPLALRQAALRRAWAADPAIRDFIGIAENQWDFVTPGAIPGFGTIDPEDVKKLVEGVFGPEKSREATKAADATLAEPAEKEEPPAASRAAPQQTPVAVAHQDEPAAPEENPAAKSVQTAEVTPALRKHGGALPQ